MCSTQISLTLLGGSAQENAVPRFGAVPWLFRGGGNRRQRPVRVVISHWEPGTRPDSADAARPDSPVASALGRGHKIPGRRRVGLHPKWPAGRGSALEPREGGALTPT